MHVIHVLIYIINNSYFLIIKLEKTRVSCKCDQNILNSSKNLRIIYFTLNFRLDKSSSKLIG